MQNGIFWKTFGRFLTKQNIILAYNPAITFLGIDPTQVEVDVYTKTYKRMFKAALFIIAQTWHNQDML